MSLLPKVSADFSQCSYWDSFFTNRKREFEWYGDFATLRPWITSYMRPSSSVLVVGAGNSNLSNDLYNLGYQNLLNVDISEVVVRQMSKKFQHLKYVQMDILQPHPELESNFDVVLDKGTLDALVSDDSQESRERGKQYFAQVDNVLKPLGRYVLVSLLEPYILQILTETFEPMGWKIQVQEVPVLTPKANNKKSRTLPVFVVTCFKFKAMEDGKTLDAQLKMAMEPAVKLSCQMLREQIRIFQNVCMLRDTLKNQRLLDQEATLELHDPNILPTVPRYYLFVLDYKRGTVPFGAFIVPQGWETEWLMSSTPGRRKLAEQCKCQRLVVVQLSRHHTYPSSLQGIQDELKFSLPALFFKCKDVGITFLAPGSSIGERNIRYQGTSQLSGKFVVEDVLVDEEWSRKLVFESRRNVVQTEARLIPATRSKGQSKNMMKVDHNNLASKYHEYMVVCLGCLPSPVNPEPKKRILILGLGGGSLPAFIHLHLPHIQVEVVEIDEAVVSVAKKWFSLPPEVTVHTQDAIQYINTCLLEGTRYDAILVDVDNKDLSVGMSCPPQEFVTKEFLANMAQVLDDSGLLLLNLVARDSILASSVIDTISELFPGGVAEFSPPEELNRVVLASKAKKEFQRQELHNNLCTFSSKIKVNSKPYDVEISQILSSIKIH